MKYEEYITQLGFNDDELKILSDIDEKCRNEFFEELSLAREEYYKGDEAFAEYLFEFAEKASIPVNTLNLYIYLRLLEDTYKEYQKRGIGADVFIETMRSFASVSRLPLYLGKAFGFTKTYRLWFRLIMACKIYRLGRLEFELTEASRDMEIGGRSLKKGEMCIAVHIPRFEDFREDACEESYARARVFFKKYYGMDNIIFYCGSWLLYPWLCEVLPETSTIVKFQKKFKIIEVIENNSGEAWIFGSGMDYESRPIEDYPEDTSLRRAAKQRLREGKNLGVGIGIRL